MVALYELMEIIPTSTDLRLSNRLEILYTFLREHDKKMKEKEACERFLGSISKKKQFNRLKNELKRELVERIISNPLLWETDNYKSEYKTCYKRFAAYKVLLLSGKRTAAIETARSLLTLLEEYDLYSLIYTVATDLRFHYASMDISVPLATHYDKLCKEYLALIHAEAFIRKRHSKVAIIRHTRKSYTSSVIEEFEKITQEVLPCLQLNSHYLNRFIYNIILCRYISIFDYKTVIKYCDQALVSFPIEYRNSNALRFNYLHIKIPALIALGKLEEAKILSKECSTMMPVGKFNWHLALLRRINVCLHAAEYQEAYDLYKAHNQQDCPFPVLWEYWQIIWGYLYFLIQRGKIEEYAEERFHLGKFLNQMPNHEKDKAGNNINLLIIQIIIRMQREEFGKIIDRVESLEKYVQKYTKAKSLQRANTFIRMIITMERASFHRARTEQKTKQLYQKLQKMPLKLDQNLAIEVIPYNVLWNEMLDLLENKFRGTTVRKKRIQQKRP